MSEAADRAEVAECDDARSVEPAAAIAATSPLMARGAALGGRAALVLGLQRTAGNNAVVRSLPLLMRERSKAAAADIKRDRDKAVIF